MSAEAVGRMDQETVDDVVFVKGAICKDENENTELCIGEATLNGGVAQSYMKILTTLSLNTTKRGPKFYCYACDYYLHTRLSMTTHMKMHRNPFCPICFRMFLSESELHAHITEQHAQLFPTGSAHPVIQLDEALGKGEGYFYHTEAPPNSPTQEYEERSIPRNAPGTINDSSISFLVMEKLRQHQELLNCGEEENKLLNTSSGCFKPADEAVSYKPRKTRSYRGEGERLLSIAGVTGKVHKATKPKQITSRVSSAKGGDDTADTSLKRLTSRFGRVISLKVPQF
uniref:C2H2-type domain-containing protein n=1 Tax=Anopheles culicifacies TaxID=139723 RepID=A0A182MTF0_9DIPT